MLVKRIGMSEMVCDDRAYAEKESLREYFDSDAAVRLVESFAERTIVVLGGDGTMLRAIRQHSGENAPFLGMNFWNRWFLLNDRECIGEGSVFEPVEYPLLDIRVEHGGKTYEDIAFNEVCIKSVDGSLLESRLSIGNDVSIDTRSDGWIVSTPAGSTGYNRSASGPVLPHVAKLSIATPLIPFDPRDLPSITYEESRELSIRTIGNRPNAVGVFTDGITLVTGISGDIQMSVTKAQMSVRLLIERSYRPVWSVKGLIEQGLKYSQTP